MKSLETVVISWALTTLRTTQTTRTRRTDASIASLARPEQRYSLRAGLRDVRLAAPPSLGRRRRRLVPRRFCGVRLSATLHNYRHLQENLHNTLRLPDMIFLFLKIAGKRRHPRFAVVQRLRGPSKTVF